MTIIKKSLIEAEKFLKSDPSHGIEHIENLFKIADYLIKKENLTGKVDREVIKLAIIFHDFGRINYLSNKNRDDHDKRSAVFAKRFLTKQRYPETDKVIEVIAGHEKKGKPISLEAMVLQDADILDVLGTVGIGRTFTYGGQIERDLTGSMKRLIWKSFRNKPATKTAKKMAASRIKFIKEFIKQYNKEINLKDG